MWSYKKQNKESNIISTPDEKPKYKFLTKKQVFFLLWNIFSIAIYVCYTFFVIFRMTEKTFLSNIIIYLLWIYAIAFVLLFLINLGNRKRLKSKLKNYKSATVLLKDVIQIVNFILAVITAISAFVTNGTTDISSLLYAVLSLIIAIFSIFFEIVKFIIRKNIPLIKQNFFEIRDKEDKL